MERSDSGGRLVSFYRVTTLMNPHLVQLLHEGQEGLNELLVLRLRQRLAAHHTLHHLVHQRLCSSRPQHAPTRVHRAVQMCQTLEEVSEAGNVEVVGEHLDHGLHQVLLGDGVVAADDLVHHRGEDSLALTQHSRCYGVVVVRVDAVQLREAPEIGADQHLQLLALQLALLLVARLAALHADPEAVHLDEVADDAVHAVVHVAAVFTTLQRDGRTYVS